MWYSHLLKNFPQFAVIHTVKGFGIINKAEVEVSQELSCFFFLLLLLLKNIEVKENSTTFWIVLALS